MGRKSLCEKCNGGTAAHYGDEFFHWTLQAAVYADNVSEDPAEGLLFSIQPLRVLKQLITMALAAADPGRAPIQNYLRKFVLDPSQRYLPKEFSVNCYLNPYEPKCSAFADEHAKRSLPKTRMTKQVAMLDVTGGPAIHLFAEIAFPPMGYVFRFVEPGGAVPKEVAGMPDLSFFSRFGLGEKRRIFLDLPVRTPVGPAPGRYIGDK